MRRILWALVLSGCPFCAGLSAGDAPAPSGSPDLSVGVDEKLGQTVALDVTLRDEDGKPLTFKDVLGKPTILTLNYFRCAGICTPLLNGLVDTLNAMRLEPGKDFQVITVSFDPSDKPEVAQRKRTNYLAQMKRPFPPSGWRFLTGDAASTRKVTDSVGFRFKAEKDQFVHAGAIIILSPKGTVTHYLYGISFPAAEVELGLNEAASGRISPTVPRLLSFCFSYDPESRQYVFSMTRAIGAAILVFAAGFVVYLLRARGKKGTEGSP